MSPRVREFHAGAREREKKAHLVLKKWSVGIKFFSMVVLDYDWPLS